MGVLDRLNAATPSRSTVEICLDGAARAEWEATFLTLEAAALEDEKPGAGSLETPAPHTTAVIEQLEEIRDRMEAAQVTFIFERIPWPKRLTLQAEHPPREGNLIDQVRGHNAETYTPAIIKASCIEVTDGTGDTATDIPDDTWVKLLGDADTAGTLNLKQVSDLYTAATGTNDGDTQVPISARSLLMSPDSGASLAQPSPGTSPRNGSAGGSRRTSRKSSATKKAASSGS